MTNPNLRIGLLGPYGFGNLGDAAIQDAAIFNIRKRIPGAAIIGYSLNPSDTERRHGIRAYPIQRAYSSPSSRKDNSGQNQNRILASLLRKGSRIPAEFKFTADSYRSLGEIDWLVVSGGGQLDDYWGGAWQHPYRLFKWASMARVRNIKLIFLSVGTGSIDSPLSKFFIKKALSSAACRSYRDGYSREFLRRIGFWRAEDAVYPDLAYGYPLEKVRQPGQAGPLDHPSDAPLTVGIGPMAYFDPRAWPEKNLEIYHTYLDQLAWLVEWLDCRRYNVVLFPGGAVADRRAILDLKEKLAQRQTGTSERVADPQIESVSDLLSAISGMDLVVATRLHSVILAQLCSKPVLALSYHRKVSTVMEDIGQSEFSLDIQSIDTGVLIETFQKLEEDRFRLAAQIENQVNAYRRQLDEQYDSIFAAA